MLIVFISWGKFRQNISELYPFLEVGIFPTFEPFELEYYVLVYF